MEQNIKTQASSLTTSISQEGSYINTSPTPISVERSGAQNLVYAGFWKRLWAKIIDILIWIPIGFVLAIILGALLKATNKSIGIEFSIVAIYLFLIVLYDAIFTSSKYQGTPGKIITKLKVKDYRGNRLSFPHALVRSFIELFINLLSIFVFESAAVLSYGMVAWTKRKQSMHDFIAKTLVVVG